MQLNLHQEVELPRCLSRLVPGRPQPHSLSDYGANAGQVREKRRGSELPAVGSLAAVVLPFFSPDR